MNISANGFMQQVLTLKAESNPQAGTPVKLTGNYAAAAGEEGDAFCGVALSCRDTVCAVQMQGTVTLPYSGTAPDVGAAVLVCDGEGGVKSAESGTSVLILAVDTTAGELTCIL